MVFAVTITAGVGAVNNDKQVVQRTSATGASGIRASGTFSGRASNGTRLQYRIVEDGGAVEVLTWTDAEMIADPGAASGSWRLLVKTELALDTVWWNWDFRMLDASGAVVESDLSHTEKWGVGLVYLFIGQSNIEFFYLQGDSSPGAADAKLGFTMSVLGQNVPWMDMLTLDDHDFHLVGIGTSYTEDDKTITSTGAFAAYTFAGGDKVYLFGAGITPGLYEIASKTNNNSIVLTTSPSTAGVDLGAVVNSKPRSGGVVNALNEVQAGATNDSTLFGDIPVGAIGMAVSGSHLVVGASPTFDKMAWSEVDNPVGIFQQAIKRVVGMTGSNVIEAVVFQQGESESRTFDNVGKTALKAAYKNGLKALHAGLKKYLAGPDGEEVKLILSGPGRNTEFTLLVASSPAIYSSSINEAGVEYAIENQLGYVLSMDIELALTVPVGLHWTKASHKVWGTRLGVVLQEVTGIVAAAVKSKHGPYISDAWVGWEGPVPLDATGAITAANPAVFTMPFSHGRDAATFTVEVVGEDGGSVSVNGIHVATRISATTFSIPVDTTAGGAYTNGTVEILDGKTNKSAIKLEITHEKGTALTLGDDGSIMCFTVEDEAGPLFVDDVAMIRGGDFMVLSLKRDTSATRSAVQDPYDAPDRLAGNWALVKYLDWPTLPHIAANREFHIFDNAATPMPLLPTFGFKAPGNSRLRDLPENEGNRLSIAITSVAAIGSREITVDSQDTPWIYLFGDPNRMVRPGDRYVIEAIGGVYIGEGTIEKVKTYVDQATDLVLTLSHDMTDQLPIVTNFITFPYVTETGGGVLARPQSVDSFGV